MGRESRVKKPPLSLRDHLLVALRRSSIRRVAFWYADMARPPEWVPDRVLREPPTAALAKSMGATSTAADVETSVQNLIESGFLARLPDGRLLLAGDDGPLTPRIIALAMWPDARPDGEALIDAVTHEDLATAVHAGMSALVLPGQKRQVIMMDRRSTTTYGLNPNSPLHRFTFAVANRFGHEKATALVARWIGVELLRRDVRMNEWIKDGRQGLLVHPRSSLRPRRSRSGMRATHFTAMGFLERSHSMRPAGRSSSTAEADDRLRGALPALRGPQRHSRTWRAPASISLIRITCSPKTCYRCCRAL
jgi:hypothetical protein